MIDPMLATGGSAVAALDHLTQAGARDIRMICIVAAPEGVDAGAEASSRRADLHAGDRPAAERSQVHRARPRRLRRSPVRDLMTKPRRARKAAPAKGGRAREVAHRAHQHRAEQDPDAGLPARRDHGAAHVRRGHLPAADGRRPVAGDRQPDGSDPRLVHRPRGHAAVDAGGAEHRDDRRAAARVRRGRRARLRPLSRRRHRELHAVSRYRTGAGAEGRVVPGRRGDDRQALPGARRADPRLRPPLPYPRPARRAAVPDGAGARDRGRSTSR